MVPNAYSNPQGALGRPHIDPTGILSWVIKKVMKPTSRKSYKTYMDFCQEKILILRMVRGTDSLIHLCSVAE